jgi:hypothetical protein
MADKGIGTLDQYVRSIRIKHLEVLMKDIVKAMRQEGRAEPRFGFTSHDLKAYFVKHAIYPPETYKDRNFFSNEVPVVTVTYMWFVAPVEKLLQILMERYDRECPVFIDIVINRQIPTLTTTLQVPMETRLLTRILFRTAFLLFLTSSFQLQIHGVSASLDCPRIF